MKKILIGLTAMTLLTTQLKAQVLNEEIAKDEDFFKLTTGINKFTTNLTDNFKKEELNSMVSKVAESDKIMSPPI